MKTVVGKITVQAVLLLQNAEVIVVVRGKYAWDAERVVVHVVDLIVKQVHEFICPSAPGVIARRKFVVVMVTMQSVVSVMRTCVSVIRTCQGICDGCFYSQMMK